MEHQVQDWSHQRVGEEYVQHHLVNDGVPCFLPAPAPVESSDNKEGPPEDNVGTLDNGQHPHSGQPSICKVFLDYFFTF